MAVAHTCAILPAKTFGEGKTRLRSQLSDQARAALARELFLHALRVVLGAPCISSAYVVTNGDDVAELVRAHDATQRVVVLRDPEPMMSLSALMDWSLREASLRAATRALILMADLPDIEVCDIESVCAALDDHDWVLVPDRRGHSTNALGLHLPFPGRTAFGQPDSLAEHCARARALGRRVRVLANERIAHDVDVPEDLLPELAATTALPACIGTVADKHEGW